VLYRVKLVLPKLAWVCLAGCIGHRGRQLRVRGDGRMAVGVGAGVWRGGGGCGGGGGGGVNTPQKKSG
jgi:hypothetical protein